MEALHAIIRSVPKPVIAKVRGNVLATLCDLTIAGESAQFGQVGPKVGSVDPGFGTAYLARLVGEKKAREIWYLCRQDNASAGRSGAMFHNLPFCESGITPSKNSIRQPQGSRRRRRITKWNVESAIACMGPT